LLGAVYFYKSIATTLDIDPIRLMSFDAQTLFQNGHENNIGFVNTYHQALDRESEAHKAHISQLQEEVKFLKEEVLFLRGQLAK